MGLGTERGDMAEGLIDDETRNGNQTPEQSARYIDLSRTGSSR